MCISDGRIFRAFLISLILCVNAFAAQAGSSNPVIQRTIAAIDADGLKSLKADLDQQCLSAVNAPRISNLPQVLTLSACREFARYFGGIDQLTDTQKETLKWLAGQPRLMPTLMSAVSGKDSPAR